MKHAAKFLASAAAFALSSVAMPAYAQETDTAQDTEQEASDGEIIVTATRSETLLSKTPIAMTAISGDNLISEGITDPTALGESVPNLSIDRNNGLQITIRGVSSTDNTEKGDPSASFMVDGIYIARPQAQEVSFYDIERVEVLRGPQGTLFGRNTTAGLVNVISKAPKLGQFGASFDVSYGNYDAISATGAINLPVGDSIALRGAVNFEKRDSFLRRGTSPFSLDPVKDNLSFRLGALFQFSDRGRLILRGDYSRQKGSSTESSNFVLASNFYALPYINPGPGQAGTDPRYIAAGVSANALQTLGFNEVQQARRDSYTWGIQGDLSYELTDNLSINYLGSYRKLKRDETFSAVNGSVFAGGAIRNNLVFPATFTGDYWQNSQEVRLAYANDRLKAQVGAYYFYEKSDISFLIFGSRAQPGQRGYIFGFLQGPTVNKSLAGFGQLTYSLTDALRVTGGIRYTKDDKSRIGNQIFHANLSDPIDYTIGVQPGTTNPSRFQDSANNAKVNYNKVTWRLGLDYDLNDQTLLFATVSQGYKAGGFNGGCAAGTPNCTSPVDPSLLYYEPETVRSYELGFKTRFADNAVRLNGTYFHYDYSNLQLTALVPFQGTTRSTTINAGAAKVDGVELEATIKPGPNTSFNFNVNWLDARYTDYAIFRAQTIAGVAYPEVNLRGRKLDRSPEWTFSAGVTQVIPLGEGNVTLNAQTRVSDEYFLQASPIRAQARQPGFTKSDISATYNAPDNRWYLQAFAKNLENTITVTTFSLAGGFPNLQNGSVRLGDPRTYGVRAGFKF